MLRDDQTCPSCGALVTPQLARCRQCGKYLHGTAFEGALLEALLPKSFAAAPGVAVAALYIILTYLLMLMLTGPEAIVGFRPLALLQLGSTVSTEVQDLEPWRFVASVFVHGGIVHILFNLNALRILGPLVEQMHDKRRFVIIFVVTGALSMAGSYGYHVYGRQEGYFPGSVGASGAITGLLGYLWVASRKPGSAARPYRASLGRWLLILMMWGFVPGVDNAAHLVGLIAGGAFSYLIPEGTPSSRHVQRIYTGLAAFVCVAVLASTTLTLLAAKDQPYTVSKDMFPRSFLFFTLEAGASPRDSAQTDALKRCLQLADEATDEAKLAEASKACELSIRLTPWNPASHAVLSSLLQRQGQSARADRQRAIAGRL